MIDYDRQEAFMSLGSGQVIMYRGLVCGKGCNIASTKAGADNIRSYNLNPVIVDVASGGLYNRG